MIVTIKDVAARAGVSPKTVSRVMNGEQHVRPAVRDVVRRAVAELGYRPNAFARSLSSSRSYLLGVFFDDPASGYATQLQRGAQTACRARGYHLLVEPLDLGQPDWPAIVEETVRSMRLDGIILPPPLSQNDALIEALARAATPVVVVSPDPASAQAISRVEIDEHQAAFDMTRYLLDLGHRDIAFVQGDPTHASARQRLAGFTAAMTAAALPVGDDRIVPGDFSFRAGLEAGDRLLDGPRRPTAIFASNDDMALGVSIAAVKRGVAVPAGLSIAGFDDAATARIAWPPITTIRQPVMELGAAAVEMLIDPAFRANGDPSAALTRRLTYDLVARESTAPASAPAHRPAAGAGLPG